MKRKKRRGGRESCHHIGRMGKKRRRKSPCNSSIVVGRRTHQRTPDGCRSRAAREGKRKKRKEKEENEKEKEKKVVNSQHCHVNKKVTSLGSDTILVDGKKVWISIRDK